ncbi:hypothetical protein FOPG_15633 [Fusarium oxysporum f. sp. conglutinans race 2 54008]|uniref:Uncharacterized protein n=1 Tax=Fusarium oxysporum f. sp. conglutinans race 2 54008 TaxID=1089457 RepID=X0I4W9_FUSOX|nr:hypothetical protein FOPG_15633 [Fusarium oxysporum f. sp. conglutinans race 2 54008]
MGLLKWLLRTGLQEVGPNSEALNTLSAGFVRYLT